MEVNGGANTHEEASHRFFANIKIEKQKSTNSNFEKKIKSTRTTSRRERL
jgi:hypothetical protein